MKDTVSVHKTVKTTDSKGIKLDDSILAQTASEIFILRSTVTAKQCQMQLTISMTSTISI